MVLYVAMEPIDLTITVLRVWLGAVMLAHAWHHGKNLVGTANWFEKIGFRSPALNARVSSLGELAIGLGLVAGLATSFAAMGLVAVMTVAFWSVHRHAGFFVFARPDEGWEYVGTLTVAAVTLAALGPGPWSLDAAIGLDRFDGWAGIGIALAGIVIAAGQLATFWRRPG